MDYISLLECQANIIDCRTFHDLLMEILLELRSFHVLANESTDDATKRSTRRHARRLATRLAI